MGGAEGCPPKTADMESFGEADSRLKKFVKALRWTVALGKLAMQTPLVISTNVLHLPHLCLRFSPTLLTSAQWMATPLSSQISKPQYSITILKLNDLFWK
jgi:hypothetical protein